MCGFIPILSLGTNNSLESFRFENKKQRWVRVCLLCHSQRGHSREAAWWMVRVPSRDAEVKSQSNHQLDLFQAFPGSTPGLCLHRANWFASCQLGFLTLKFIAMICFIDPEMPKWGEVIEVCITLHYIACCSCSWHVTQAGNYFVIGPSLTMKLWGKVVFSRTRSAKFCTSLLTKNH